MKRSPLFSYLTATVAVVLTAVAAAQLAGPPDYDLSWNTIDGGGGTSVGGSFELSGTIGQPDAGGPMTGGNFSLTGGFWAGGEVTPTDTCPADLYPDKGDGIVDVDDLLVLINDWGKCPDCEADLEPPSGNNVVDVDDLLVLINAWGLCP